MKDFKRSLSRREVSMFSSIKIGGNFAVSIQASSTHYCTPRKTLPNASDYTAFEIAIFEDGDWISPLEDDRFSEIRHLIQDNYETGTCPVGAYISDDVVQKICDFIEMKYQGGLKQ